MDEAFYLLDHQPLTWPRWELGRTVDGHLLHEQHMFLFVSVDFALGVGIAACRFIDGADWIERATPVERGLISASDPLCQNCMEVSLQHGLARM